MEPGGVAPGAPVGAGHRKIPTAAHPQSPQPRDTERTLSSSPPQARHHTSFTTQTCMQSNTWKNQPTEIQSLGHWFVLLWIQDGFPKVQHPKVQVGFWFCWLQIPALRKGWFCLNYCAVNQNPADEPKWTSCTSFWPCGNQPGWRVILVTRLWLLLLLHNHLDVHCMWKKINTWKKA